MPQKPLTAFPERNWAALKRAFCNKLLAAEAVEGAAVTSPVLGVLGVGDSVQDHVPPEHLQHPAVFLVDEAGDALDPAAAGQAADGGLGDVLDVVPHHLAVALGAAFAQALSALPASRHFQEVENQKEPTPSDYLLFMGNLCGPE